MSNPNKKRPRNDDDEEEDREEEDANNNLILGTPAKGAPPGVSPPGTKLRSGRKVKPRRSLEEKIERLKKRAKTGDGKDEDDDDDEEMDQDEEMKAEDDQIATHEEEDDDDEEDEDEKAPSKPVAVTSKMPPLPGNLRLPAQKTPGRVAKPAPVPAAAALKTDSHVIEPPGQQQQRQRMNLVKTPHKKAEAAAVASPPEDKKPATSETQQPAQDGGAPLQGEPFPMPPWLDHALNSSVALFFVMGLLMLPTLFVINPFLDSAVGASKLAVPVYQSIVGSPKPKTLQPKNVAPIPAPPPPPPKIEYVDEEVLSEETVELMAESQRLNETLLKIQEEQSTVWRELDQVRNVLQEKSETVETQLEALQVRHGQVEAELQETLMVWQKHSEELNRIASLSAQMLVPGRDDPERFFTLTQSLHESDANSLLHIWDLPLWDPPMESCDIPKLEDLFPEDAAQAEEDDEQSQVVTRESVMAYWDELRMESEKEFEVFSKDEVWKRDILNWIHEYADKTPLPDYEVPEIPKPRTVAASTTGRPSTSGGRGPSGETIRRLIDGRMEVERADGTGRIDYAALFQGASIIKTGTRATSPSLADKLPLFNRLMAVMGAQFYGYGPEAALTPSYPTDSLGQCWAFVEDDQPNRFGSYSYAVLTVRLAKPISVNNVSIEHPVSERWSHQARNAIRKFRIYGYVDADATSDPIGLGNFEFPMKNNKRKMREEFELEGDNDEDIPKLAAISLVVESTWGSDYTCLYRFRVHGRE